MTWRNCHLNLVTFKSRRVLQFWAPNFWWNISWAPAFVPPNFQKDPIWTCRFARKKRKTDKKILFLQETVKEFRRAGFEPSSSKQTNHSKSTRTFRFARTERRLKQKIFFIEKVEENCFATDRNWTQFVVTGIKPSLSEPAFELSTPRSSQT